MCIKNLLKRGAIFCCKSPNIASNPSPTDFLGVAEKSTWNSVPAGALIKRREAVYQGTPSVFSCAMMISRYEDGESFSA